MIEQPGVGREVRARRSPDRLLIDAHHSANPFDALDDMAAGFRRRPCFEVIDLLIVGRPDRDVLTERLDEASRLLGRPVNEVVFEADELAARRERGDGFVRSIDDGQVIEVLP